MLHSISERWRQGYRTSPWPNTEPALSEHFRGVPEYNDSLCEESCTLCAEVCPTAAITRSADDWQLDLGGCIFCGECVASCGQQALSLSHDYRMATRRREDLIVSLKQPFTATPNTEKNTPIAKLFGKSLKLRQVSAGGCNACEADVNVLGTLAFDMGRFGIQFVASPRHADGLLITGPVTENMRQALLETYTAIPEPKIVIAVGSCAISGCPYHNSPETHNGIGELLPVDLYIPGCPPHPYTTLDGILRLLGRR